MARLVQTGIFKGNLEEFNTFLAIRQMAGDSYQHSQRISDSKFYFAFIIEVVT